MSGICFASQGVAAWSITSDEEEENCFLVCMSFIDNKTLAQLGQEPEVAKRKRAKAA